MKALDGLGPVEQAQVMNYLKGANLHRALLLNFGKTVFSTEGSCYACRRIATPVSLNSRLEGSADLEILGFPVPPDSLAEMTAAVDRRGREAAGVAAGSGAWGDESPIVFCGFHLAPAPPAAARLRRAAGRLTLATVDALSIDFASNAAQKNPHNPRIRGSLETSGTSVEPGRRPDQACRISSRQPPVLPLPSFAMHTLNAGFLSLVVAIAASSGPGAGVRAARIRLAMRSTASRGCRAAGRSRAPMAWSRSSG